MARRLTGNRHVAGIAAERRNVIADPLERRPLIEEAIVTGTASSSKARSDRETRTDLGDSLARR